MNAKRILFFDIDGTLLDHNKRIPLSTKQAIQELKAAGHEIILASGRSPFMLEAVAKELKIASYVGFNGQYVVLHGELIYTNPFQTELLNELAKFAKNAQHPLVYLDPQTMGSSMKRHPYVETCFNSLQYAYPSFDPCFYYQRNIYQTMLFCTETEEKDYITHFPSLQFVRWHPLSMDVLPAGGSKANGIMQIMKKLGSDPGDAYAFGDNLNDIEMFQYIGNSIAMGNSPDSVKRLARYVTTDVDQGGIAHGLRMVGLLT